MKSKRQAKIIEFINTYEIETQGELTRLLAEAGFEVTQATVSRDVHEMRLTKVPTNHFGYRYIMPERLDQAGLNRLKRILKDGFVSMDYASNMLVIRTFSGMATAVAAAIDGMAFPEIIGSLAGDNVVMCAVKSEQEAIDLIEKIKRVIE
ncbi:MAG: arginine repressor [Turicibacter sp.]|nr:arginine repressor [Turicibacter sp.]